MYMKECVLLMFFANVLLEENLTVFLSQNIQQTSASPFICLTYDCITKYTKSITDHYMKMKDKKYTYEAHLKGPLAQKISL